MAYWLNGAFETDERALSVNERGFLLGDGVFETILLVNSVAAFWAAHRQRLCNALSMLGIAATLPDDFPAVMSELARKNDCGAGRAVARVTVSRGASGRGLAPLNECAPTILASVSPIGPASPDPVRLVISEQTRRARSSISARCKTIGYLDNIVARREALAQSADDAILLNDAGRVACAAAANIFLRLADGRWLTPAQSEGALGGIVRAELIADSRVGVVESEAYISALADATIFISNSLVGVRAAVLNGRELERKQQTEIEAVDAIYQARLSADLEEQARTL